MTDYRVEIKVKNNHILKKIEEAGYETVGEFCRLNNKKSWAAPIGELVNLKVSPLKSNGDFIYLVYKISKLLNCSPEDLFSESQLTTALESNKRTIEVKEAEMKFMLDHTPEQKLIEDVINQGRIPAELENMLDTLTPREKRVIEGRFGLNGNDQMTLEEIADEFDVGKERIRQIEATVLRKLRHPSRSHKLLEMLEG